VAVALLRFALVLMAISLCAPMRGFRAADAARAFLDADSWSPPNATFDDDSSVESGLRSTALPSPPRAIDAPLLADRSSVVAFGVARGLAPAPGVTTSLFRPPRL
jgi:hypothetical protein